MTDEQSPTAAQPESDAGWRKDVDALLEKHPQLVYELRMLTQELHLQFLLDSGHGTKGWPDHVLHVGHQLMDRQVQTVRKIFEFGLTRVVLKTRDGKPTRELASAEATEEASLPSRDVSRPSEFAETSPGLVFALHCLVESLVSRDRLMMDPMSDMSMQEICRRFELADRLVDNARYVFEYALTERVFRYEITRQRRPECKCRGRSLAWWRAFMPGRPTDRPCGSD